MLTTAQEPLMAGLITTRCTCCPEPRGLVTHAQLDAARRLCPSSRLVYLDRGDGSFEVEGGPLPGTDAQPADAVKARPEVDVLSDRPARTDAKTRITLERATFA